MVDSHLVLIVEDSEEDYVLTTTAFEEVGITADVEWCRNGDDALRFLRLSPDTSSSDPAPQRLPGLVLLDLNLPLTDGRKVLAAMRENASTKGIPVIILSTSDSPDDVRQCYEGGANSYLTKAADINTMFENMRHLKNFWFDTAVAYA